MKLYAFKDHRNSHPWAEAPPWAIEMREMMRALLRETELQDMATQAELDTLKTTVADNTSAVAAAKVALDGYAQSVTDLTAQLQAAIAASPAADDADVQAAIDALKANNTLLAASTPAVAAAVVQNTSAAPAA